MIILTVLNPIRPAAGGGGISVARMIKFTAVIQKPLTLWCLNFVTFDFYLQDVLWANSSEIGRQGGLLLLYSHQDIFKNFEKEKIFLYLEIAKIDMGSQFWAEKNNSGHKN